MKLDICESLVYSYLRHIKKCQVTQINWKPSGNWAIDKDLYNSASAEYERIQQHKLFYQIFKTDFDATLSQTELDVLGIDANGTIYVANTAFNENGVHYGSKTDTRNRVVKNLLRAHLALSCYFPKNRHVLMFCSPKVLASTDEVIRFYFNVLDREFTSRQTKFIYLANDAFRDKVLMETLDATQHEFDTSELFLRSFRLLTAYTGETQEEPEMRNEPEEIRPEAQPASAEETEVMIAIQENPTEEASAIPADQEADDGRRAESEILKIRNRVPKWFQNPKQYNSKILITFLQMKETSDKVSLADLAAACKGIRNFSGNFVQMNNMADKNHGKVFNGTSDDISLWEPVSDFILTEYALYKKSLETV